MDEMDIDIERQRRAEKLATALNKALARPFPYERPRGGVVKATSLLWARYIKERLRQGKMINRKKEKSK